MAETIYGRDALACRREMAALRKEAAHYMGSASAEDQQRFRDVMRRWRELEHRYFDTIRRASPPPRPSWWRRLLNRWSTPTRRPA